MIDCLGEGGVREDRSALRHHAIVLRRFRRAVEANPDRTLYMTELCAAAGASDRTLRACCQEFLGMSPMRYLWLRRMHLARRALRMADPAAATVTEIATSYGFWELGRFSVAYRSLFAESPSAALRRPPDDRRVQKKYGFALAASGICIVSLYPADLPSRSATFPVGIVAFRAAGLIRLACRKPDAGKRHWQLQLGQDFTELPQLNQARIWIVAKVAFRQCAQPHQLGIVLSQKAKIC
jgi:AraC-like DNA-binding protein